MRIAYLISAYTDPAQLMRTIGALDSRDSYFFIHLDKKSLLEIPGRERVTVLEKRYYVQWGGWNQVLYQKALLEACQQAPVPFDRIVLISGQDFPLVPPERIEEEFRLHPHRQYLKGLNISAAGNPRRIREKVTVYHFFRDLEVPRWLKQALCGGMRGLMRLLPVRKKPYLRVDGNAWNVYQASSYMALTAGCARFVLAQMNENKALMRYFRYSYVPEELVIPTILFNSPFRKECMEEAGTYRGLEALSALTFFHYRDEIHVFDLDDYDELKTCGRLFARKMKTGVSDALMDRLEKEWSEGK